MPRPPSRQLPGLHPGGGPEDPAGGLLRQHHQREGRQQRTAAANAGGPQQDRALHECRRSLSAAQARPRVHLNSPFCSQVVNDLVFSGSSDQCVYTHNIHVSVSVFTPQTGMFPSRFFKSKRVCVVFVNARSGPDRRAGAGVQGPQSRRHRSGCAGEGDGDGLSGQTGARLRPAGERPRSFSLL